MFTIGLTGNIASGKSTVINLFKSLGANIIIADDIARELTQSGSPALVAIKAHFGPSVITAGNELNRAALRRIIFDNTKERLWLEALLHPQIQKTIAERVADHNSTTYNVIEIPLLKDRNNYPYLDRVLALIANEEVQIARVIARDHCDVVQAKKIIASQPSIEDRKAIADDLLINDGNLNELTNNIKNLHEKYLQLAMLKRS
ncbi:dephospho-CoA kinase [Legionella quinlivanii]|uniref:Dephospho-CoA kinase n=1 Tax=Legionella quinlivanii TaxID=45073 RepID=A0A0W0Y4N6_9GAMM|nr:dephospho-CoA kinase [Legionella quinlivanii]KTD51550.1 dephospho-CoA kinase [Legionella quinlivanii]SEF58701.1 dephospho-CoA kinase [Legionella quinlivanii DSM 21216]STY10923.1 dephospho-CoA kinase [Legionella quinlivanii]